MLLLLALSLGCNRPFVDYDYEFPPGLAPLAENQAAWPENEEETVTVVAGESADFFWGHARAGNLRRCRRSGVRRKPGRWIL